jgi:hypothetical protein
MQHKNGGRESAYQLKEYMMVQDVSRNGYMPGDLHGIAASSELPEQAATRTITLLIPGKELW